MDFKSKVASRQSFVFERFKPMFFLIVIVCFEFFASVAFAQHKGISIQATMKAPDGSYPSVSGSSVTLQILDPGTNCVLREEVHSGVNILNGYVNLTLGSGSALTPAGRNPSPLLSLPQVMDNTTTRTGLNCIDANNTIIATNQTYTPTSTQARKLRLRTVIGSDEIVADFNLRAVAFAVNAENLDGKTASDFIQTSANITQSSVESIFSRYGALNGILNGTYSGNASTATALAAAPGACSAGQYLTAMTANGTITCGTPAGSGGTVTAVTSANTYLSVATGTSTPVLTLNVGTAANTVAAGNDSRFTDSRAPTGTAGGDLSGNYPNPTVAKIAGKSVVLTTPVNGEFLKYDGANFVNAAVSTSDTTKLPLAGGTMAGGIDMALQNLTNVGFITMSANKNIHLSNNSSDPTGLVAADKGKIWFNSTSGEIKFWDGSAAQPLGVAGSGLQTFNTQTGTSQTLAIGASGTAPAWNSVTNTHTLNIPMASTTSVTAGLLSKTDYDVFNAKLGTATSFAGDVTGTFGALSVDKIKGKAIAPTTYAAGQALRYDGTSWVNSVLSFADLGSKPTTLAGYGITDAQSSTLADGKIFVGNGSNVATAVTLSGDATLSNAGALTLATVPMTKRGTGVTSFAGDKIITTSAAGALQASSCALNQVISFTAGGAITCVTPSAGSVTDVSSANADIGVATGSSTPVLTLNTGTAANQIVKLDSAAKLPAVDGAALTALNASNLASGTVAPARMPAFTGDTTVTAGTTATTTLKVNGVSYPSSPSTNTVPVVTSANTITYQTLPAAAGGTGQTTYTIGDILYASSTSALSKLAAGTSGHVLKSNGAGTAPSWQADVGSGALSAVTAASATNTIDNLNFSQTWNWSTATTQSPLSISANALTTGSLLQLTTSNASVNSTNGLLNVANSGASTSGMLARFQSNSTAGSGLTVLTNGNVGVGTAAPSSKLSVTGDGNAVYMESATATNGTAIYMLNAGNGSVFGIEHSSGGSMITGSSPYATVFGNQSARSFHIGTNNAVRVTVDSTGRVGIGNTSPGRLLHVGSASVTTGTAVASFQNADGTCTVTPAASGSGIACSSDERLKENFKNVQGEFALDKILSLQAVSYNFKTAPINTRRTGYKAQEVQKIAPEFVRQNDDGYLQVYYDAFIPWITEAMKLLHGRITANDLRVHQLEAENAQLKQENAAIKARLIRIERALDL